jgi:anti-sigma B factor antagonist
MEEPDMTSAQQESAVGFGVTEQGLDGDVALLVVVGELDVSTVPALRDALTRVHDRGVSRLVIDLAGVNFIDSVSVASLVNTQRRLRDGRFALVVPEESYGMLIFQAGGIESVLPIFETRDQAIAHARS